MSRVILHIYTVVFDKIFLMEKLSRSIIISKPVKKVIYPNGS